MSSQYNTKRYPPIFTKNGDRVYRLGEPGSGDPRKIKVQDYRTLRNEHLAKKILFRDTEFQPYKIKDLDNDSDIEWMRPNKICEKPKFCSKEYTRFDVKQGSIGDCWFVSCLSVIAMRQSIMRQVIPSGQSFKKRYAGIFRFRFWQYGNWIEVVVDDRLPTLNGELFYGTSRSGYIFWSALLEKAYAKLYGNYNKIYGGTCDEAFLNLTGGVSEAFNLKDPSKNFFPILLKAHTRDSLLCTATDHKTETDDDNNVSVSNIKETIEYIEEKSNATVCDNDYAPGDDFDSDDEAAMYANFECDDKDEDEDDEATDYHPIQSESLLDQDIIGGHAYSLTAVRYVTSTEEGKEIKVPLVRIRNPWGRDEWSGRWSDNSPEWKTVSKAERKEINLLYRKDGEFWMHYDDFIKQFDRIYICHWKYDHLALEDYACKRSWEVRSFEGEWINYSNEDEESAEKIFSKNPQLILDLTDPDEEDNDDLCTLIISLQTKDLRIESKLTSFILIIYKREPDDPKAFSKKILESNIVLVAKQKHFEANLSGRYRIPPGSYYIFLLNNAKNIEGKVLFRIFTENPCTLKINDDKIGTTEIDERVKDVIVKPPKFKPENLCWIELKEILNYALATRDEYGFSKDACRSMIAMQDKDYTGSIDRIEFKALWDEICILKAIFHMYDAKNNGSIPMYNLQRALRSAGFIINEKVYNILAQRYAISHDGNLILEDFLICALRLKKMFATYKQKLDANNNDCVSFTLDDWITNLVIY